MRLPLALAYFERPKFNLGRMVVNESFSTSDGWCVSKRDGTPCFGAYHCNPHICRVTVIIGDGHSKDKQQYENYMDDFEVAVRIMLVVLLKVFDLFHNFAKYFRTILRRIAVLNQADLYIKFQLITDYLIV